jgi:hypothetical protein
VFLFIIIGHPTLVVETYVFGSVSSFVSHTFEIVPQKNVGVALDFEKYLENIILKK